MFPKSSRILIIDDSEPQRQLLRDLLSRMGFASLFEASDGMAGYNAILEALKAGHPYDLVISDLHMKPMSGLELLKKVRMNPTFEALPFIMVTSETGMQKVRSAISEGVSEYIVKPLEADTLSRKLANAWAKNPPAQPPHES